MTRLLAFKRSTKTTYFMAVALLLAAAVGLYTESSWAVKDKKDDSTAEAPIEADPIVLPPQLTPELVEKRRSENLCNELNDGSTAHWLSTDDNQKFLALHLANQTAVTQGTVLILPDNEHHPDWPGTIHFLRTELTNADWSTVSISLPDFIVKTVIPPRAMPTIIANPEQPEEDKQSTKSKNTKESENKEPEQAPPTETNATSDEAITPEFKAAPPIEALIINRIKQALRFIDSQGNGTHQIIVIAEGLSALWITHYLTKEPEQTKIAGVILISARGAEDLKHINLNNSAAQLGIPLLDITSEHDLSYPLAVQRKKLAKKTHRAPYQLIKLHTPGGFRGHETQLLKRIKGWLRKTFEQPKAAKSY